jgi:hypothetical protein
MEAILDKIDELKTYRIKNIEVFSAGKWNEDDYSVNDLYAIVDAFNSLKVGFRPYLKLGHDDKQNIVKSSGMPSIGWVSALRVNGTKLLADFENVPEKLFKLIKAKAYRKVSCEIYWNLTVEGSKYSRVLGAIALLGAENPGVMNLDDILGNYTLSHKKQPQDIALFEKQDNFKTYSIELNPNMGEQMADEKTEKELALEQELETVKKEFSQKDEDLKKITEEKSAVEKEIESLKQYKLEAEKREQEALAKVVEAQREQFVSELEGKKLLSPAMKPYVNALLASHKDYSIDSKEMTKEQVVEEILKLASEASKVNFEETSKAYAKGDAKDDDEKAIKEYMDQNKCSYVQAYKAVMKEKK